MTIHPNQERILKALKEAVGTLGMTDQLAIVGGLARHLGGDPKPPGDIDVLIEKPLCERYWDFLEVLVRHGIRSVRDVLDRPSFDWRPCVPDIAHARALTIDCQASCRGEKHGAIDICFHPDYLDVIPNAHRWVDTLDLQLTGPARDAAIRQGRERLRAELQGRMCDLRPPVLDPALGLYYRLTG